MRDGLWFRWAQVLRAIIIAFCAIASAGAASAQAVTRDAAMASMERAAAYFRDRLGNGDSYVWAYSVDLTKRRGEGGVVDNSTSWNQPPGSPAIGAAYLRMFEVSGDKTWLDAAHAVAKALISVQLRSGGWYYSAELGEERRRNWCYRGASKEACGQISTNEFKNRSVLDDDTTQSVLGFLIWFDEASKASDPEVRRAIDYGMKRLIGLQYPNGAFPVFSDWRDGPEDIEPLRQASLPAGDWPRTWVKPETPPYFVVNDDILRDTIRVLLYAGRVYDCGQCVKSAKAAGEFLLAAQLPAPQRGWAQTYDRAMQPVWGRVFEPPAVASRETAGSIQALLLLHAETGDDRYLEAAREAMEWLKTVRLDDGDWARFYELATNKPLYVNSKDEVTYSAEDLLDHYMLKSTFEIPQAIALTEGRLAGEPVAQSRYWVNATDRWSRATLEERVAALVATQDSEGRWIEEGWINSQTFVDAVFALARYIEEDLDQ